MRKTAALSAPPGLWLFKRQYDITDGAIAKAEERLPALLETVAGAIGRASEAGAGAGASASDPPFLVGDTFTIADIAVASALILIGPPADEFLPRPMPEPLRRANTHAGAQATHAGVFGWRDAIYRRYRKPVAGTE